MLENIAVGSGLIILTAFVHGTAMVAVTEWLKRGALQRFGRSRWLKSIVVHAVVLTMFLASVLEAAAWAATYMVTGAIAEFEPAMYFSMVTYTTLGYGDVVLSDNWRLLASFQAGNGIIMFGWTTALIMSTIQRVYFPHSQVDHHTELTAAAQAKGERGV